MAIDFTGGAFRKIGESLDDQAVQRRESSGATIPRAGFRIRMCDISGTPWRIPRDLKLKQLDEFALSSTFREFYRNQQEVPRLLEQRIHNGRGRLSVDGSSEPIEDLVSVEVVLFALPIPVSQVVAALVVQLIEPTISNEVGGRLRRLRDAMVNDRVRLDGQSLSEIVDSMAARAGAERVPDPEEETGPETMSDPARLEDERHLLIFAHPMEPGAPIPPDLDEQARALIYGVHWPYQPEFATISRPEDLNSDPPGDVRGDAGRPGRYAAVSHYASVLYGQSEEVDVSTLVIAAQTVGTAARFQSIWRSASKQVADFQRDKRAKTGEQTRKSLAPLADEMGDLELDLTFNVQTAADLGLGSTSAFVDSFQRALHVAMKFKDRAETVATMFERVNSSIQSELTAIVSREREAEEAEAERRRRQEEKDRIRGAAVIGALTFFLAPITVVFGFFGISTDDVGEHDHMFDFRKFWLVYAVAAALMLAAVVWALVTWRGGLHDPKPRAVPPPDGTTRLSLATIWRRRRRRSAEKAPAMSGTDPGGSRKDT